MESLKRHEQFEIEVLDSMKASGLLRPLVFGGGTMLRLCHELPRYSVDLDFWFTRGAEMSGLHRKLTVFLKDRYRLTDCHSKRSTLLYELSGPASPRKLKIEIRKEIVGSGTEEKIAFSRFGTRQVLVRAMSLEAAATRKIAAALARTEIRDFFDLEFLIRRGCVLKLKSGEGQELAAKALRFRRSDFTSVLGSLLEKDLRDHYARQGFAYLIEHLTTDRLPPTLS